MSLMEPGPDRRPTLPPEDRPPRQPSWTENAILLFIGAMGVFFVTITVLGLFAPYGP